MSTGPSLRPVGLLVALAAVVRMSEYASPQFALDDAWISFRVARNLLDHGQLTFDVTQPPVEGMTNLLWTLLSLGWIWLLPHVDPLFGARVVGAACHVGTVVLAARISASLVPGDGGSKGRAALLAGASLALSGSMGFHALSGLETPLFTLLFTAAVDRLFAIEGPRGARAAGWAGVWLTLLAMTRPEGVLVGLCALALVAALPSTRSALVPVAVPWVSGVGAMELFRRVYYGAWVPNTFGAKPPDALAGLHSLGGFVLFGLGALGLLAIGPALRRSEGVWKTRALAGLGSLLAAGTVWSGGDWMPGYRRYSLTMVCCAILVGVGVCRAAGLWRVAAWSGAAAVFVGHLAARLTLYDARRFPEVQTVALAHTARTTPGVRSLAATDIGRLGWYFPGSILDFAGLTDAHIARLSGTHLRKRWDEGYFRARAPDLVIVNNATDVRDPATQRLVVHPVELGALRSIQQHGGYQLRTSLRVAEQVYLLVLARDGLELPEAQWGPRLTRDLRSFELLEGTPG